MLFKRARASSRNSLRSGDSADAMPIVISHSVTVCGDDGPPWRPKEHLLRSINGETFIKLAAWDRGFTRFVCGSHQRAKGNASLAQDAAMQQLRDLRAARQQELDEEAGQPPNKRGIKALLGDAALVAKRNKALLLLRSCAKSHPPCLSKSRWAARRCR